MPLALRDRPFTVREGLAAGMTTGALRSSRLHTETRAVRSIDPPERLVDRARAFAAGLPPDVAFSHVTSLRLMGLPLPSRIPDDVLHVMRESERTRIRRTSCCGHRGLESRGVAIEDGLRLVGAPDSWCDLGELSPKALAIDDLIVAGDAILTRLSVGPAVLEHTLESRTRPRGKARLSEALQLIRPGSRSPMESLSRLMFVRAGFPEPTLNAPVLDREGGWLLTGDLVWEEERVVAEYQGAVHAPIHERSDDSDRMSVAFDEGVMVFELFAEDVFDRRRRIRCLSRVARALGLDTDRLRIA